MSISVMVLSDEGAIIPPYRQYTPVLVDDAGPFSKELYTYSLSDANYLGFYTGNTYLSCAKTKVITCKEPYLHPRVLQLYGLDSSQELIQTFQGCDVLTSYPRKLTLPLREYLLSDSHIESSDLQALQLIVSDINPCLVSIYQQVLKLFELYEPVAIVMHRDYFLEFWRFAESIVHAWHERIAEDTLPLSRIRSHRLLFSILLQTFLLSKPDLSIKQYPSVQFDDTSTSLSLPSWKDDAVPVVFASNERFAPALGVCMNSMLAHTSHDRLYDIVVLESDLSEDSKQRLHLLCNRYQMVNLRFFNPQKLLEGHRLLKNPTDHISMETYYRFLIADILPQYSKVLYLDCDTVVLNDIADLFDVPLCGNVLAAALDPEIPSMIMGSDSSLKEYFQAVLGLKPEEPYLQAGVLVLDLDAFRRLHSVEEWITLAGARRYRFNDQDILNMECKNRFLELPMEWNTVVDCNHRRMPIIEAGPYWMYKTYCKARKHPKLVHYAGFEKPWDAPFSDFAYLFWHYARDSEFYDRLLGMLHLEKVEKKRGLLGCMFPRGSKRRIWAKKIFYRVTGN